MLSCIQGVLNRKIIKQHPRLVLDPSATLKRGHTDWYQGPVSPTLHHIRGTLRAVF